MCDPVSLTIAATAATMAGQGMSMLQAKATSKYQQRVAERNASLDNEAANREQENTREAALAHYRQVAQLKGQQRLAQSANGVSTDFGSAVDVANDTEMLSREDVSRIYEDGFQKARGFEISASNNKAQANAAKQAGKNAIVSGVISMAGTALSGAKQYDKLQRAG